MVKRQGRTNKISGFPKEEESSKAAPVTKKCANFFLAFFPMVFWWTRSHPSFVNVRRELLQRSRADNAVTAVKYNASNNRTANDTAFANHTTVTTRRNDSASAAASVAKQISDLQHSLNSSSLRYYMYTDTNIDNVGYRNWIKEGNGWPRAKTHWGRDIRNEIQILDVLRQHRDYQVDDLLQADLYMIPFSIGATLATSGDPDQCFGRYLGALYNTSTFQSTMGHRHILLSLLVPYHKYSDRHKFSFQPHYSKLWNVTVANDLSWAGCQHMINSGKAKGNDFESSYESEGHPFARHGFSMGLTNDDPMLLPATRAKFDACKYLIFYRTRESPSFFNSTQYRHAPIVHKDAILAATTRSLQQSSSIGFDLPKAEWMEHFVSSKFCLVIRGDTVHTHSLLRAVKAGCIPVIVANDYPYYAPTFASSIQMKDYAIFLDEAAFLKDTVGELSKLQALAEEEINNKLLWLAYAQQIFFPDHPESLFVPAFLQEAHRASRRDLGGPKFPGYP